MTNFVDDRFAKEHGLMLTEKSFPLKTEAYNGEAGLDVNWELDGKLEAICTDGTREEFGICLNVTRLGKHEVMIGLPWMEEIGCFFKLIKGGSYVLLGQAFSISANVIEEQTTLTLDCKHQSLSALSLPSSFHAEIDTMSLSINSITSNTPQTTPFQTKLSRHTHSSSLKRICD